MSLKTYKKKVKNYFILYNLGETYTIFMMKIHVPEKIFKGEKIDIKYKKIKNIF